jgi:hypothetical protein
MFWFWISFNKKNKRITKDKNNNRMMIQKICGLFSFPSPAKRPSIDRSPLRSAPAKRGRHGTSVCRLSSSLRSLHVSKKDGRRIPFASEEEEASLRRCETPKPKKKKEKTQRRFCVVSLSLSLPRWLTPMTPAWTP